MVKILLVEDSYGKEFYKHVLRSREVRRKIIIRRLAGARCNPKIERQIKAFHVMYKHKINGVAIIVDSEGEEYNKVKNNLMRHIAKVKDKIKQIEIFIIDPSHEKLLCLGLGGNNNTCSNDPVTFIERKIRDKYNHNMLGKIVVKADVNSMLNDQEFNRLISFINDP